MAGEGGLRLVRKAVEVLDLLGEGRELTIAQLAERSGEPRSSLYRLLGTLEQLEMVEPTERRGYFRLGVHVMRLGIASVEGRGLRECARPALERLRTETGGLTAYLVVRRDREAVCIERVEGTRVASMALKLGGALPLHAGAAPRALLAFSAEDQWREYTDGGELRRLTDNTPAEPERLYEVLAQERAEGICVSDGDVTVGIAAIGAPIFDHDGAVVAAMSVSGLRDEVVGPNAAKVKDLVAECAADVSRALGHRTS
ncbi:IclR family transcriptional regulator [Jiangella asiatica]|uniref:IclR family transcriptional regulator n=1 Tax=Jiangella asiatica TaxID=2530372 RepID=A0A4R5DIS3_9ACTN|nr:IclR family transcriptional regulator [Jiangella asiatica]TDE11834.1 IclR family transcriptional regulator [Jiangella asiatica]